MNNLSWINYIKAICMILVYVNYMKIYNRVNILFAERFNDLSLSISFYEVLFLGKPLFTTNGTIVKKVKKLNTDFTSEESLHYIEIAINCISYDDIIIKGRNSANLWLDKYQYYTFDFMKKILNDVK